MKIIDQLFNSNIFTNKNNQAQSSRQSSTSMMGDAFSALKNSKAPGMDKVESMLRNMNRPVSDSEVSSIEKFMSDGTGSVDSKLETVKWAADKDIEMTDKNLNAIHESLNSEMNEAELIETLSGVKDSGKISPEEIVDKINSDPTIPQSVKDSIAASIEEGLPLDKAIVRAVKNLIRANVEVKGQTVFIQGSDGNENCICISLDDLLQAVESAFEALESGEGVSFEDLLKEALVEVLGEDEIKNLAEIMLSDDENTLEDVEGVESNENEEADADIKAFEDDMIERLEASMDEVMSSFMDNSDGEMAAAISDMRFKTFLVTKITAQAIEAKKEFNEVKKEIVQNLRELEVPKTPQEKADVKEMLGKAIEKLDNLLMKSDVTLFTDMKMERDLLNMSSTLQEARKLLGKGEVNQALDIAKNVQNKLDQMIFKPSEKNVQLMAFKQGADVLNIQTNTVPSIDWQDASPRGVLELFRNMGLNHEPEVAEKLLSQDKSLIKDGDYKIKDNLKAVLLKLMESEEPDQRRAVSATEKSLNNLTGQQLMNKLETKQDTQTLFFHVPVNAAGEVKDMKLFVNARKNGDSIDWENSSLYFSVDLKKYGETGIHIQTKDKLLSISVKNDNASFENVMKPLVTVLQKEFVDVGFKLGPVNFTALDKTKSGGDIVKMRDVEKPTKTIVKPTESEKGFDFSI